jgi:putative pre-16S rRNA nuclease
MTSSPAPRRYLALDVGEQRIGVATGDSAIKIASPVGWYSNDESFATQLEQLLDHHRPEALVVGYPRNQSGEPTKQTAYVEQFMTDLRPEVPVVFQDEALTSVQAEERLMALKKPYSKGDIDIEAAVIILQDFLEAL